MEITQIIHLNKGNPKLNNRKSLALTDSSKREGMKENLFIGHRVIYCCLATSICLSLD